MALDMPSGGASPSPRSLRGEGRGEGLSPHGSDSRRAPSSRPSPRRRGEGEVQRRARLPRVLPLLRQVHFNDRIGSL